MTCPEKYHVSYELSLIEEHIDSSDFEDSCTRIKDNKESNATLHHHMQIRKRDKKNPSYSACDVSDEYSVEIKRERSSKTMVTKAVQVTKNKNRKKNEHNSKNLNDGDQQENAHSKLSLTNNSVCSSSIFRRTITNDKIFVINKNQSNYAKENSCQYCSSCEEKRQKNMYKTHEDYTVQTICTNENNMHKTLAPCCQKTIDKPLSDRSRIKSKILSSSESETHVSQAIKQKTMKIKKRFKAEVLKEHQKYQRNEHLKNQQYQSLSKNHRSSYHVFTSENQQSKTNVSSSNSQSITVIPASASGFWDYLFNKVNRKYLVKTAQISKQCQSDSCEQLQYSPSYCKINEAKQDPGFSTDIQHCPNQAGCCACNPKPNPSTSEDYQKSDQFECLPLAQSGNTVTKTKPPENASCECNGKESRYPKKSSTLPLPGEEYTKPCQLNHEDVMSSLKEKYNGEILCIHNPPCILINGCLSLPPKDESQMEMNYWPVTKLKRTVNNTSKKTSTNSFSQKIEQYCQYHVPSDEGHQLQTPERKVEKSIQSICSHDPPCEVVRRCCKPEYDLKLQTSCIHVPMCKMIRKNFAEKRSEEKGFCEHRPKCPDIPMCSTNYALVIPTNNFNAQVNPKTLLCREYRYKSAGAKDLKSRDRMYCESSTSPKAIPGCKHQHPCGMFPACFRKPIKKMVSVSSQYPNSCRIV